MSLTKATRKLLAAATKLHLRSLRLGLRAYAAQRQAALIALGHANELLLRAQEEYDGAKHEENDAIIRYTMEADTLGAKL